MGPQVEPKCFRHLKHMRNNWELRKRGYLIRFGHTEALLLKKRTLNGHFSRPAETDPYPHMRKNRICSYEKNTQVCHPLKTLIVQMWVSIHVKRSDTPQSVLKYKCLDLLVYALTDAVRKRHAHNAHIRINRMYQYGDYAHIENIHNLVKSLLLYLLQTVSCAQ